MAEDVKKRIEQLRGEIREHDYLYYVLNQPKITDPQYDKLFTELEDEALITPTQEKAIALAEDFEEAKDAGDKEYKEKNTTVTFRGCTMSLRDKIEVEEGKKVIILNPKNRYEFRSTEGMSAEKIESLETLFTARRADQRRREDEALR